MFVDTPMSERFAAITWAAVTVSGYSLVTMRSMVSPVSPELSASSRARSGSCSKGAYSWYQTEVSGTAVWLTVALPYQVTWAMASRSMARATARRASGESKGGRAWFMVTYQ